MARLGAVRLDVGVSCGVAVLAALARLPGVYNEPFWEDEVASARILQQPTVGALLQNVARTESTPPLWYLIGWTVHQSGVSLREARLLSVFFGGLFAGLVVLVARRFVPPTLAALAGLMSAFGTEFVWHGHELRAYALFALLSVVFILCLLRELDAASRRVDVALGATVAAGGLTHFFFAFSALAALAWLWFDPGARAIRRRASVAILAGGSIAAAWTPVMMTQYQPGRFWWIGSFKLRHVAAVPLRLLTSDYNNTPAGLVLSVLTLLLVAAGCVRLCRGSAHGRVVAALAVAPIVLAAAVWKSGMPIFDLRNLVGAGAALAICIVVALDSLPRTFAAPTAVALSVLLALSFARSEKNRTPPYDTMAQSLVREGWNSTTPIAVFGDVARYRLPLEWYLPRQPLLVVAHERRLGCKKLLVLGPGTRLARVVRESGHGDAMLRGATLLVPRSRRPRCVRTGGGRHHATIA